MKNKRYKIYIVEEIKENEEQVAHVVFSTKVAYDKYMSDYDKALKSKKISFVLKTIETYIELPPASSGFNVPLNPKFNLDILLIKQKTDASTVKIEAQKKPKTDKMVKTNDISKEIEDLEGIKFKRITK